MCDTHDCPQQIFAEQAAPVAQRYARRTQRLDNLCGDFGLIAGGEPGARLIQRLHLTISVDTIPRVIRRLPHEALPTPHVLGVDDWAQRKGQTYDTILVDHERWHVVALLPDRRPETLAHWLRDHAGVEIVSRDRSEAYAQGIREGAPHFGARPAKTITPP